MGWWLGGKGSRSVGSLSERRIYKKVGKFEGMSIYVYESVMGMGMYIAAPHHQKKRTRFVLFCSSKIRRSV